jgi:protein SCO1/2
MAGTPTRFDFRRSRRTWLALTVSILLALVVGCGGGGRQIPPPSESIGTATDQAISPTVGALPLVDSTGRKTTLDAFRGKILVLSDIMTLCQETCPLDTANVVSTARAVDKAGLGDRVEFASVTIDPQRDTPARLAAYRKLFSPVPTNWALLTGSQHSTDTLWKALGVYHHKVAENSPPAVDWMTGKPLTYDINHADLIFFVNADGHNRFVIDGAGHVAPGTTIPAELGKFMDAQGHHNLTHPDAGSWTTGQALQVISWLTDHHIDTAAAPR